MSRVIDNSVVDTSNVDIPSQLPPEENLSLLRDYSEALSSTGDGFENALKTLLKLPLPQLVCIVCKFQEPRQPSPTCIWDLSTAHSELFEIGKRLDYISELVSMFPSILEPLNVYLEWDEKTQLNEILSATKELKKRCSGIEINILGPSPPWVGVYSRIASTPVEELFEQIRDAGITSCRPAPRSNCDSIALRAGLQCQIQLDVFTLGDELHLADGPESEERDQILLTEFCNELLELRDTPGNWKLELVWDDGDRRLGLSHPFAVPIVKAICLGKIILPREVSLVAPAKLLGKQLATFCSTLLFSDFGPAAVDSVTARQLDIPLVSEVSPYFCKSAFR